MSSGGIDGGGTARPAAETVPSFVDNTPSKTYASRPDLRLGCFLVGALIVLAFFVAVFGVLALWLLLIEKACSDPEGCEDLVAVVPPFGLMLIVWPMLAVAFVYAARWRRKQAVIRRDAARSDRSSDWIEP